MESALGLRAMGLDGNLEDFPLADVLQLINMGSRTGLLTITNNNGNARIWFEKGQAVHAVVGDLEGEKAVYETFNWKSGRFSFDTEARTEKRSIQLDCQNLIMEAVRRLDEWTKFRRVIPSPDYVVNFAAGPNDRADNIILQAHEWKVLSLVNGELDIKGLAASTGFSEFKTTQIVFDLVQSGLLAVSPPDAKPAPPPGQLDTAKAKSLREFLSTIEEKPHPGGGKPKLGVESNVAALARFVNALLDNFDKPNGLYNAVKQDKRLADRFAEQADRYPQVQVIKFSPPERINVEQLDADVRAMDDLGKKNLIVALTEVKEQIFATAERQSNKIAATRRYNKTVDEVFGPNGPPRELGLGTILEKKSS